MRKLVLTLCVLITVFCIRSSAQIDTLQSRESEWKSYSLPQGNFIRKAAAAKEFIFRVPADWEQEGDQLTFRGPHSATLRVHVDKVPDGYPLQDYVTALLRALGDVPGATDSVLTRRVQIQDLEAREILIDTPNTEGEMSRNVSWVTVVGPAAVLFNLQVPLAHIPEIEPFFKTVVQSVLIVPIDYKHFEELRPNSIKELPEPANEVQDVVAKINQIGGQRENEVKKLALLFKSAPDTVVDLLLDRRDLVRAAAVKALAQIENESYEPLLWRALDDSDALVAEAAGRRLANATDFLNKISNHSLSRFGTESVARIWPFLTKEKKIALLEKVFSKTAVPTVIAPPIKGPKNDVTVEVKELVAIGNLKDIPNLRVNAFAQDPNNQIGMLLLLKDIPVADFRLPLARLTAANYDPLTIVGLQVAHDRAEVLPLESLFKLVASQNVEIRKLAIQSLAYSAGIPDIARIEAVTDKSVKGLAGRPDKQIGISDDDKALRQTIKKVRFRVEFEESRKAGRDIDAALNKALADPDLAEFAWRIGCQVPVSKCSPIAEKLDVDFKIKPFAENLFPSNVTHYATVPKLGESVQRFYETLHGIQMDSPRKQTSLVVMMAGFRQILGQTLDAPAEAPTIVDYTGIKSDEPIALAEWSATGDATGIAGARRRAIVVRTIDRDRFERLVQTFQSSSGSFMDLTNYVAIGSRGIAALPAFLPLTAKSILSSGTSKPKKQQLLKYSVSRSQDWNGLQIKIIEARELDSKWHLSSFATYMVSVGDSIILAPDLESIRDLLTHTNTTDKQQHLSENTQFRQLALDSGDILYFSDLKSVLKSIGESAIPLSSKINESGSLKFSTSTWENTHKLVFDESEWAKSFIPFHPKELLAPSELLPNSTIAYWLMKIDLAAAWNEWANKALGVNQSETISKSWALDFKKEVLPELGPECGAVILDLPEFENFDAGTLTVFCKLKTDKLSRALSEGTLLRGVGPASDIAELKVDKDSYFVAIRKGYLLVSNKAKGITALDQSGKLASTRDFSKTTEQVPNGIVAFGGYNLEAAIGGAQSAANDGLNAQVANILFSFASAFHSQNFFAIASSGAIDAHSSVSMDREGRYSVADLSTLSRGSNISYATLEPHGLPIVDQKRISSLIMRIRGKGVGAIENIREDIRSSEQLVEQKSPNEMLVTIMPRRGGADKKIELPVTDPTLQPFLKATAEISSADKTVIEQARKIAGDDRDAWSVARKLSEWIHKNLQWKFVSEANASQTLLTREADCSEFSQLYVSMARSLGLPARIVSGLAYSGETFGGHAWVEVWVGKWIELDPTWGTDFVDATHIRNSSSALITSAALNLIELEVVEAKRSVADFQKTPRALVEHLSVAIPQGNQSEVETALDLGVLTDEFMGTGTWGQLSESERNRMSSGYRRLLLEIVLGYGNRDGVVRKLRLLHLDETSDSAEALCMLSPGDMLLKLRLMKRGGSWHLREIVQADTGLHTIAETLEPSISFIKDSRSGVKTRVGTSSDFLRVILLTKSNSKKAIEVADGALKNNPTNQGLRFLKANALLSEKEDQGLELLGVLSRETPGYAPAIFKLANWYRYSDKEEEKKQVIDLYQRYIALEPADPRGHSQIALAYDVAGNLSQAEIEYRKAIECDPKVTDWYFELIQFLVEHDRIAEAGAILDIGEKYQEKDEDLFGSVMESLYYEEGDFVERFAAGQPRRMRTSGDANMVFARANVDKGNFVAALRILNLTVSLKQKSTEPFVLRAEVYRKLSNWIAALKAADQAISIDDEVSEAYYHRACALARLRRPSEAIVALTKAIELDEDLAYEISEEKDLGPLSSLQAFKKLIRTEEKP